MSNQSFHSSLFFEVWITISLVLTLNLVRGYAKVPPTPKFELKVYLKIDGTDCLQQIKPIHNFTIDESFTPEQEKQVLLDIYHNTNGHDWYNNSGWDTPNETSHCNWYGITCHNNKTYVKSIALYSNNLSGFLPATSLWKLRNLLALCMPSNPNLQGRMEDIVLANLSKIRILHFDGAALDGEIPEEIGSLSFLQRFFGCRMYGKGLSGTVPDSIGDLKDLTLLCLNDNSLTGQIPRTISKLNLLTFLDLRNPGKMSGFIQDLFSIKTIEDLYVSGVKLYGNIPREFPPKIRNLVLPGNEIQGSLPTTFPETLRYLNVANNHLKGDISSNLLFLPYIEVIDVSQNSFSSINNGTTWPNSNKSLAKYISLAGNRNLSIEFESFTNIFFNFNSLFGRSSSLTALNVSFCDIESPYPPGLQFIDKLLTFDMRGNRFYGGLPDIHADNLYMSYLDISANRLTGDLPKGTENLIFLQYLDISGNSGMKQKNNSASKNIVTPDFSKMTRPLIGDNFTCPQARLTFNNGRVRLDPTFYHYRYCVCDSGYYGDSGLCRNCMPGGKCKPPVTMSSKDVNPTTMIIQAGYWPSPSANNVTHFVHCPVPKACNPNGDCTCHLQTFNNFTTKSSNRSVLSLITTCNTSCICHNGNTDRYCSRCLKGYYKSGGLCYHCPKDKEKLSVYIFIPIFAVTVFIMLWSFFFLKAASKIGYILVGVEFLLLFIFTLLRMMPAWVFKLDVLIFVACMTNRDEVANPLIKIGIFYIQTLDSMVSSVNVWPQQVFVVQHYVSSFWNLQFSSLTCDFSFLFTPVGRFAFILLLPILCTLLIISYFIVSFIYYNSKQRNDQVRATGFKCRQLTMSCLNFTYFPIVEATVSVLRPCDSDHGIRFMPKIPWIECLSPTYHILSLMGWISVVFYVLGFPIILFILMIAVFRKRPSMSTQQRHDMDSWLGSVYLPYKPKYQLYYELIIVIRRLLLAFALSFLASSKSVQTVAVWFILTISAITQFRFQPYLTSKVLCPMENVFEFVILFVLSMSFIVLRFSAFDTAITTIFVWLVMIVNGCVLVGLITCVMYRFVLRCPYGCWKKHGDSTDGDSLVEYPVQDAD